VNPGHAHIEQAGIGDAEAILNLQKLAYRSEALLYDDWALPPLTQTLDSLREEFARSVILKAVVERDVVGSVRARVEGDICHIGRLIVHPEHQRRGLGARLMAAIEAEFPGVAAFQLFTGSRSEGNLRLYRRLGYRPSHEKAVSAAVTLVFLEKTRVSRT
jgi:ribosomal protein S18 acetylase RimI-like enzyme